MNSRTIDLGRIWAGCIVLILKISHNNGAIHFIVSISCGHTGPIANLDCINSCSVVQHHTEDNWCFDDPGSAPRGPVPSGPGQQATHGMNNVEHTLMNIHSFVYGFPVMYKVGKACLIDLAHDSWHGHGFKEWVPHSSRYVDRCMVEVSLSIVLYGPCSDVANTRQLAEKEGRPKGFSVGSLVSVPSSIHTCQLKPCAKDLYDTNLSHGGGGSLNR